MTGFSSRLRERLQQRRDNHLYRQRLDLGSAQGPEVTVMGRRLLNFCSNDYLGLAAHPALSEALSTAARRYGVGSGASHLVCGHSELHDELERRLASLTGRPRALLFSSGYAANLGVLTTLLERGDEVIQDRLNHASLLDGGMFSGARLRRFTHNDPAALAERLATATSTGERLVVVDGVFSMDGDRAPLGEYAALCREHGAWMMVDDAHGLGVTGPGGAGSVAAAGLDVDDVPVLMATLGKALGTSGAFVAGTEDLIEALIQGARNYIYTTATPPALAAATLAALDLLDTESWRHDHLQALIARFVTGALAHDLPLMPSDTAIQPLLVGGADRALALSKTLQDKGFLVGAIRPPTVPAGTARLRITLTAAHTEAQIDALVEALAKAWAEQEATGV